LPWSAGALSQNGALQTQVHRQRVADLLVPSWRRKNAWNGVNSRGKVDHLFDPDDISSDRRVLDRPSTNPRSTACLARPDQTTEQSGSSSADHPPRLPAAMKLLMASRSNILPRRRVPSGFSRLEGIKKTPCAHLRVGTALDTQLSSVSTKPKPAARDTDEPTDWPSAVRSVAAALCNKRPKPPEFFQ